MARVTRGTADFHIEDGRLTMEMGGGAAIYVDTPDTQPLSELEPQATLRIVSEVDSDAATTVDLDGKQLEKLQTALAELTEADSDD